MPSWTFSTNLLFFSLFFSHRPFLNGFAVAMSFVDNSLVSSSLSSGEYIPSTIQQDSYKNVHMITLFRGGVSEHPIPGRGDAILHHPAFLDNNWGYNNKTWL